VNELIDGVPSALFPDPEDRNAKKNMNEKAV
jgi:hypothetical protein